MPDQHGVNGTGCVSAVNQEEVALRRQPQQEHVKYPVQRPIFQFFLLCTLLTDWFFSHLSKPPNG